MVQKIDSRVRVVILINELLRGGAQRIVLDIVRTIDRDRFAIVVVCLKSEKNFQADSATVRNDMAQAGIPVVDLGGGPFFRFKDALVLYHYLKESRPEILHTFLPYAGILGRLVAPWAGVRSVISVQCNLPVAYDRKTFILDKITLPLATAWVGATEGIERSYGGSSEIFSENSWEKGRRHFTIVAGVDLPVFDRTLACVDRRAKRNEIGIPSEATVVMMIARLISWKGHADLIAAMKLMPPTTHLVLVGWGPLETELRAAVRKDDTTERVHFLGARNDVTELLATADVYVQAHGYAPDGKIWMGPNTSQMEACAALVPSVSTAVPLIESLIEDGKTGRLAQPNNPEDLARRIMEVCEDPVTAREQAKEARKRVEERYSVAAMVRTYQDVYEKLIQSHGKK